METATTPPRPNFQAMLRKHQLELAPISIETLQVNITKICNQACQHCHVDAGPKRTESMSRAHIDACLSALRRFPQIRSLDVTGGAPELHPDFDYLVISARQLGVHVMVRHNLTVTFDGHPQTGESKAYLPEFFAGHRVEVISSLPYYQEYFTDKQRGRGVFEKSMRGISQLNALGYGAAETGLKLNLVYNPVGAFLPAPQAQLEEEYKASLFKEHGIVFNHLYAITNMPIQRFKRQLQHLGQYDQYMEKLTAAFNTGAAAGVMCRSLISVGYDGSLYDCDFNQMLNLKVEAAGSPTGDLMTIDHFDFDALLARNIRLADHCYGCTAGAGSSCGGSTA